MDLDGLTPNWSQELTFSHLRERRFDHVFKFPQLTGRGVFLVDLVAGSTSSRVVIHKGWLSLRERRSAAGHNFTYGANALAAACAFLTLEVVALCA